MASNDYFSRDPLPDGKPDARHTYDGLQFLEDGTFWAHGGSRAEDGHGTNLTWLYDDATGWTNVATTGTGPGGYSLSSGYDPASGRVLVHGAQLFYIYDVKAKTWSSLPGFGFPPLWPRYACAGDGTGAVDTKRGLFWSVGSARCWSGTSPTARRSPTPGPPPAAGIHQQGLRRRQLSRPALRGRWRRDLQRGRARIRLRQRGRRAGRLAERRRALRARFEDAHLDRGRRRRCADVEENSIGTYGRWCYIQAYNVFILVNSVDENVYFYKNTEGCGPP